tara:strand:+ start:356 stop:1102 length:747 start_codon:yes stop_codon:yes gene_type:complete
MPCGSESWGIIWWASGDNGGRSTHDFFKKAGCVDFKSYDTVPYRTNVGASWNDYYWSNIRSHTQGVPPELKGCPVISNARNPYAKVISNFADRNLEHYRKTGEDLDMKPWIYETYKDGFNDVDRFPWVEWGPGTTPHEYKWDEARPTSHAEIPLPFPTYHLRVEHLVEDIMKIPEVVNNADPDKLLYAIESSFNYDAYHERHRRIVFYNEDGTLDWEGHMDQELADFIYEGTKLGFDLCGYERDSWKK